MIPGFCKIQSMLSPPIFQGFVMRFVMKSVAGFVVAVWMGIWGSSSLVWAGGQQQLSISQVKLYLTLSHPWLQSGKTHKVYLKVGLQGFELPNHRRSPVNLAVVLDRSGSMSGENIRKAKDAARLLVHMLKPDDIFSLVTYDTHVEVLVPATKVTDKADILRKIDSIEARGFTALFGGVSKGIAEVRKFLSKQRVNRVILLSDGLANVGPSSPNALGRLGAASAKLGVAITTIGLGLGYNEDLMTQLARHSDGNHGFARNAADLERIFRAELQDVLSVVAQEVVIHIQCAHGVRPIRILDRTAEIRGQDVRLSLNQLYSRQEKYFLLELEVPAESSLSLRDIATVQLSYGNMQTKKTDKLSARAFIRYSALSADMQSRINRPVMIEVIEAIGNENNRLAVLLRDKGQILAAQRLLLQTSRFLNEMGQRYKSMRLQRWGASNENDAKRLSGSSWNNQRKLMRKKQYKIQNQTSY